MAVSNLDRAKVQLVTQHPFFASILLKRKLIEDNTIPTAAVDQRGQIYYNKQFVDKLSVDQLVFLLCHEVGHVIGQHASRRGARHAKKWNIAGDSRMQASASSSRAVSACPAPRTRPSTRFTTSCPTCQTAVADLAVSVTT